MSIDEIYSGKDRLFIPTIAVIEIAAVASRLKLCSETLKIRVFDEKLLFVMNNKKFDAKGFYGAFCP